MFTRLTHLRVGAAVMLGVAVLGGMEHRAAAQGMSRGNSGFRVNQTPSVTGGGIMPGMGSGFSFNGQGGLPTGSYGMMSSSPNSGITSAPYSSEGTSSAYGSGYSGTADPYGGYLKGAAEVIGATGKYGIDAQRAYVMKEQVQAAQIENRRRIFDEWLYERTNMPTLQDELERTRKQELRRSRLDPPRTEIWSAKALNAVLDDLKRMDHSRVPGGDTLIDTDVLKRINVTSGKGSLNLGVLKNDGKLDWSLALRGPSLGEDGRDLRHVIQSLVSRAYKDAKESNPPDPGTIREIRASITRLEEELRKHINELGYSEYTEARTYLGQLKEGVNLLQDRTAADFINGRYTLTNLKSNTVGEVVNYMRDNGLQFAPAVDGEQAAYTALHRALANFDIAANSLIARAPQ